ncbi:MAG: hypothetical protein HY575_03275 [candidate division NC10 bacterium]|nr:hypothetical protein [candidate division NC10 bacterium]MBI4390880.1 hypothetical protein [candidate division NC10 bacterium]
MEWSALGPLGIYRDAGPRVTLGLRPLLLRETDAEGDSTEADVFYPFGAYSREREDVDWRFFTLFRRAELAPPGREEATPSEVSLYPFLFWRTGSPGRPGYFAFFPLGGHLRDRFGRDDITFALFPLYARTVNEGVRTTHLPWPVIAAWSGPEQSGWQLWPLYGRDVRPGRFDKTFVLWPFGFHQDLDQDTENPKRVRVFLPFYSLLRSPQRDETSVLWPFFSKITDRGEAYEEWHLPWPIVRVARGESRRITRVWPLYSSAVRGSRTDEYVLWPLYVTEREDREDFRLTRHRILYYLVQDAREELPEEGGSRHRLDVWPFFVYEAEGEAATFQTLALLESFLPRDAALRRSWAPLWTLYRHEWGPGGHTVSSLLWNLYRREAAEGFLAWQLAPLVAYRAEDGSGGPVRDLWFLLGLIQMHSAPGRRGLRLLYLPWITWGGPGEGEP